MTLSKCYLRPHSTKHIKRQFCAICFDTMCVCDADSRNFRLRKESAVPFSSFIANIQTFLMFWKTLKQNNGAIFGYFVSFQIILGWCKQTILGPLFWWEHFPKKIIHLQAGRRDVASYKKSRLSTHFFVVTNSGFKHVQICTNMQSWIYV